MNNSFNLVQLNSEELVEVVGGQNQSMYDMGEAVGECIGRAINGLLLCSGLRGLF